MAVSEAAFQETIIEAARLYGWLVMHTRPTRTGRYDEKGRPTYATAIQGDAGFPDLVLARGDRIIFAELKAGRRTTTPEQDVWLAVLGEAADRTGGRVVVRVWRAGDDDDWADIVELLSARAA